MSEAKGIFQADIVIRSAIMAALADLRANPWLLDYVFSSLPKDALTKNDYGEQEVEQAKKWFLNTNIHVVMSTRMDDANLPCISIALVDSSEAETTLGDVHYQTAEGLEGNRPILATFSPLSYSALTGIMILKDTVGSLGVYPGMVLVDATGKEHSIKDVLDDYTVTLEAGTVADFSKVKLMAQMPHYITQLESVSMKETYSLGCHAQAEPVHLTYLHSVLIFALYRYKESLLEARGFERSTVSSSDFNFNPNFENEVVFSRFVTLSGYVRQYWPKAIKPRIQGIDGTFQILGHPTMAPQVDPKNQLWTGEDDDFEIEFGPVTDFVKKEQ